MTRTWTIELANAEPGDLDEAAAMVRMDHLYTGFHCTDDMTDDGMMMITATLPEDEDAEEIEAIQADFAAMVTRYTAYFATARV